jgi:hypothetical protein
MSLGSAAGRPLGSAAGRPPRMSLGSAVGRSPRMSLGSAVGRLPRTSLGSAVGSPIKGLVGIGSPPRSDGNGRPPGSSPVELSGKPARSLRALAGSPLRRFCKTSGPSVSINCLSPSLTSCAWFSISAGMKADSL